MSFILVAHPEEAVRELLRSMLEVHGHESLDHMPFPLVELERAIERALGG